MKSQFVAVAVVAAAVACTQPNPDFVAPGDSGAPIDGARPDDGRADAGVDVPALDVHEPSPEDARAPSGVDAAGDGARPDLPMDAAGPLPDAGADTPAAPVELARGLRGHWPLDETDGVLARNQLVGAGADAVVQGGAVWARPGFTGARFTNPGCLVLDGVDDNVISSVGGFITFPAARSVSLWVWVNASSATGRRPILTLHRGVDAAGVQLGLDAGRIGLWLADGASVSTAATLAPERWHHLALVFDGSRHEVYVDGARAGELERPAPAGMLGWLRIGPAPAQLGLAGRVDDLRLWDRALDPAEIAALDDGR